jgi:hypothetical protein
MCSLVNKRLKKKQYKIQGGHAEISWCKAKRVPLAGHVGKEELDPGKDGNGFISSE